VKVPFRKTICTDYVFFESGGEHCGIIEGGKGTLDGGHGTGKGQAKKVSKTPRLPKLNQKTVLAHLVILWRTGTGTKTEKEV